MQERTPDEVLGLAVKAFVVLEEGSTLSVRDLERECRQRLEPFCVPKLFEVVPSLPKITTGKIRKTGLS